MRKGGKILSADFQDLRRFGKWDRICDNLRESVDNPVLPVLPALHGGKILGVLGGLCAKRPKN
jgi:hypothetical protein